MAKAKSKSKSKQKRRSGGGGDGDVPSRVLDLAELARKGAAHVTGVDPDYTYETLPLVDMYLREVPEDATEEVLHLIVASSGCYFGEVARRVLNGRWAVGSGAPEGWRMELASCFLYFYPVGMAGEVYSRGKDPDYDGSLGTMIEAHDGLSEMLANAAPFSEDEYYSLACRVEVLQLAADWLTARPMAAGKRARIFTAADYSAYLDQQ